jgi:hypothetical protein
VIALSELRGEDYWRIKWQITAVLASLLVSAGMYLALLSLNDSAELQLRNARAALNRAQTELNDIEQEEARIIANIDSYARIQERSITLQEDRLEMLENFARIRAEHSLFPVQVNIDNQDVIELQPTVEGGDGSTGPVMLRQSRINFELPLLHENDLLRLLASLSALPDFLLPESCRLSRRSGEVQQYIYLGQHFQSACTINWFTMVATGARQ